MNYDYLFDTNIISALVKNPRSCVFDKIKEVGEDKICTSIIVACELKFGAMKKKSPQLIQRIETILSSINILSLKPPVQEYYGKIRAELESKGTPIGANDLLIGVHALCLNLTVITDNSELPYTKSKIMV
ncbi:type II toxin-antitoxin system VapC family toxin [Geminocystis herdmanii]|uniref:type II toxin-antitoxin system VapC family toxin n=1 Tax=Geminocystis herdmanii TaxID=669359 RepID=UPI0003464979|nr:type II toxin-antitoxin system VapC family toxin [Geminocystis herdmanii]